MDWFGQLALNVGTAAIASWVAVQLALGRFYKEKWWEKKFAAYTAILEALHRFNRMIRSELNHRKQNPNAPSAYKSGDVREPIGAIWRAMDMGELLASREMLTLLKKLVTDIQQTAGNKNEPEMLKQISALLGRAIPEAVRLARKDLRLAPWDSAQSQQTIADALKAPQRAE